MSAPPAFRPRLRDILRIAVAAVGITAGLAGVPIVLWWAAGTLHYPTDVHWFHLDHNVQSPPVDEQFRDWLYHTYHALRLSLGTDGLIVLALLALAGLAWLKFVWLTLVELVLLARDGTELLLDRAQQVGLRGWIASLLTTLTLSTSATTAHAATAAPATTATAPPQPGTPNHAEGHADAAGPTTLGGHTDPPPTRPTTHLPDELRPDCPRYRVHAGDTLIRIATQHLGHAARWRDLAELNQPWLPNPNQLAPGWQLLLPPDAPAPEQPEVTEITISPGDTLANLAETHLNDPERLGELYDLNAGRTQPDGLQLADPNILLAGWKLLIPTGSADTGPEVSDPPDDSREAPAAGTFPRPAPATPPSGPDIGGIWAGQGTFLGWGLAATISLALAVARAQHRRHYRPGVELADLTLAPTVHQLRWEHLRATRTPDTAYDRSTVDTAVGPPAVSTEAAHDPDAAAGLPVEIGVRAGHTSTIDLAACEGLGVTGPAAEPVTRALLLHLLSRHSSTTATPVQLVLTRPEAERLLATNESPPATVRIVDDLPTALDLLEHAHHDPHPEPQEHDAPLVLVTRAPTEHAHRLHRLLQPPLPRALGAILLGPWPEGTTLSTDADAHLTHTPSNPADELHGTRLFTATPAAARELLPLTPTPTEATTPLPAAHPDRSETALAPPTGTDEALHASADENPADREPPAPAVGVTLRVFGPMRVVGIDAHGHRHELTPSLTSRQRELLAYLAIHPDGVARDTLITDLWHDPTHNRPTNALNTLLSRLRSILSQASCGALSDLIEVDTASHHRYRLNPQLVTTDYAQFQHRKHTSHHSSDTDHRLTMLNELVATYTGPLAADIDTEWIQAPRYQAQRSFINAISTLARHRITDDPEGTLDLLESALNHDPYNESLYRDIMRLQHQLAMPHSITHTLHALTTRLADIDAAPTTETTTLAHQLVRRDPPQHPDSLPAE